jgi:Flp pilus assembly protein TadD
MKIVQKILSHGLLIVFFVAVFFVYLYRGDLFPQWFDQQAQTGETPSPSAAAQSPVVGADEPQPAQAAAGTDDESQATAAQTEAVTDGPVAGAQSEEPAAPTADAATAAQYRPVGPEETSRRTNNLLAEAPDSVTTAPEYRPLKAKKTAPPVAAVDSGATGESDFRSQLEQARQQYWRSDMSAAEQAYRRLTESHPERAEVWGELGNLFFSQREMVQATDAYYRAIDLLIEQGDAERARQLLGTMYQLDAEKADELDARLRQAGM